jgi:hypothetical protein
MMIRRPIHSMVAFAAALAACGAAVAESDATRPPAPQQLMGNRFLTFNTIVRVHQIEVAREVSHGPDESSVHTPEDARVFREAIEKAWPGGRITWAFSWRALHDDRKQYRKLRDLIVSYHRKFGDEITFIPGAYFAPMYNTREQVNRDLHEGLKRVSEIVGDGYRPKSLVAGFLSAESLRYLAEEEGIHVAQGTIWSQYAVDNGDGEGSIAYPCFPSREHYCKPARGADDFIDIVNLDGWTVDFLCARIPGQHRVDGEMWRAHFKNNDKLDYQFVHRGSGIRASQEDKEIRWFMNRDFRLALPRDWKEDGPEMVIDFTRYDLPASEPADPAPGQHSRNWSLMNRINQKGTRPQDVPVALAELPEDDQALIRKHYPQLFEAAAPDND